MNEVNIYNKDGIELLKTLKNNTVDLILTDPPYLISKKSGMNDFLNILENNSKTLEEWEQFKHKNKISEDLKKKRKLFKIWKYKWKKICI